MKTTEPEAMTDWSMAQAFRALRRPVSCSRLSEMFWMMKTERESLRLWSTSLRAALKSPTRPASLPSFLARADEPASLW